MGDRGWISARAALCWIVVPAVAWVPDGYVADQQRWPGPEMVARTREQSGSERWHVQPAALALCRVCATDGVPALHYERRGDSGRSFVAAPGPTGHPFAVVTGQQNPKRAALPASGLADLPLANSGVGASGGGLHSLRRLPDGTVDAWGSE